MARLQKLILVLTAVTMTILSGCSGSSGADIENPVTGVAYVMNTVLEYKLYGENAQKAAIVLQQELTTLENEMSMFIDSSDVAIMNREAGKSSVKLADNTYELLTRSMEFCRQSEGAFDITIAPLTRLWDVTSESPRVPSEHEILEILPMVNYSDISIDSENRKAKLAKQGESVDVGGVAKGYACDIARRVMLEQGVTQGYISIGGNLMIIGEKPSDGWINALMGKTEPFKFGVRNPRGSANEYIAVVTLKDSTMATSGDYERFFEVDGRRYHHILDPATGYPANNGLMSVSVISEDGAYADFMSTMLFVKGREYAIDHINDYDCGLILIDTDRNVYVSSNIDKNFTQSDPTGTYHFEVVK